MEQQAWSRIYDDLEHDIETSTTRASPASGDMQIYLDLDRARFAIERGDSDEAITVIHDLKEKIRAAVGAGDPRRGEAGVPTLDQLESLEERLHAEVRLGSARLEVVGEDEVDDDTTRSASKNTKVNRSIKFEDIGDEYVELFDACKLREEKRSTVKWHSDKVVGNREAYEKISDATSVPWWFIGLIHGMECSFNLAKHLHNGDSLNARTWQVPAGRPKTGSPPFTFFKSACDALEYDKFAGQTDWPLPMVLYRLERYNGFGYRKKFGTASPYLWSFTSHFTAGKYIRDGVYDPNALSKQCGAAAMLRDLMDRGIVSFEAKTEPVVPKPDATPTATVPPYAGPSPGGPQLKPVEPGPAPVPAAGPTASPQPEPAPLPAAAPPPTAAPAPDAASTSPSSQAPETPASVPKPAAATDTAGVSTGTPAPAADSASAPSQSAVPVPPTGSFSPALAAAIAELSRRSKE